MREWCVLLHTTGQRGHRDDTVAVRCEMAQIGSKIQIRSKIRSFRYKNLPYLVEWAKMDVRIEISVKNWSRSDVAASDW